MPAIQPRKLLRVSKMAEFMSVTCAAVVSKVFTAYASCRSSDTARLMQSNDADACVPEPKFCEQVADNIVIVAGIEGDLIDSAAIDDRSYDIERLVAIERRNFDGDHVGDFREPAPEFVGKHAPSYRGLEVKTDHRNDRSNGARVIEECGN